MNPKSPMKPHPFSARSDPSRPSVRSASMRKSGKDGPSYTPTEKRKKDKLMRQFIGRGKGNGSGVSAAYRANFDAIDWGSDDMEDNTRLPEVGTIGAKPKPGGQLGGHSLACDRLQFLEYFKAYHPRFGDPDYKPKELCICGYIVKNEEK